MALHMHDCTEIYLWRFVVCFQKLLSFPSQDAGVVFMHCAQVSTKLVGLALSYTLQLSGLMQWAVRQTAEAENEIVAVERILQYTELPQEPPTVAAGGAPAPK